MEATLRELAELVGGQVRGDGQLRITGAATLADAGPGDITLVDSEKHARRLDGCRASAVLAPPGVDTKRLPTLIAKDVHQAFAALVTRFRPPRPAVRAGISSAAQVSPTAVLADDVDVHPGAVIGDDVRIGRGATIHSGVCVMAGCRIGDQTTVFPNAVLYENTVVGRRVIIHAGAVIGAYGFGYDTVDGRHRLAAQLGHVRIEDDVEIGACTTIDRGAYGPTVIGEGTKIDNHVMIAHNCRIGRHNLICGHVALAGSCVTGDYVVMAGQVGVSDHVTIGDRAVLGAKAGVMNDIPAGGVYVGIPATPAREQMVKQAAWSKLPAMRKQLQELQRQVERLAAGGRRPAQPRDAA